MYFMYNLSCFPINNKSVTKSTQPSDFFQGVKMAELETDYLVIGAGATSMTFIDEVISNTEDVKIIGIKKYLVIN